VDAGRTAVTATQTAMTPSTLTPERIPAAPATAQALPRRGPRREKAPAGHSARVNLAGAEEWIHEHVEPAGPAEVAHERPWSTVLRVPVGGGAVWSRPGSGVHAFEPRLSAGLSARWPGRVAEVL